MADYKQLLGKAIEALPENNGAARRQVYEKARNALVAQLRGIDPPLPSREITQHRLQLEDCIRQVEQAATDALLGVTEPSAPEPAPEPTPPPPPAPAPPPEPMPAPEPTPTPQAVVEPDPAPTQEVTAAPEAKSEPEVVATSDVQEDAAPAAEAPQSEPETVVEDKPEPAPEPVKPKAADILKSAETESPVNVTEAVDTPAQTTPQDQPIAEAPEAQAEPIVDTAEDTFAKSNDLAATLVKEAGKVTPVKPVETKEPPVVQTSAASKVVVEDTPAPADDGEDQDAIKRLIDQASENALSVESVVGEAVEAKSDESFPAFPAQPLNDTETAPAPVVEEPPKVEPAPQRPVEVVTPVAETPVVATPAAPPEPQISAAPAGVTAMSHEREVDVDAATLARAEDNEAQGAIDRAIQTLDREARGETSPSEPVGDSDAGLIMARAEELRQDREQNERGGGGAITIFLVVLALLLAGAGGAGYWALQEGYIDVDALFGESSGETVAAADAGSQAASETNTGPGNTTATPDAVAPVAPTLDKSDERLPGATGGDNSSDGQTTAAGPSAGSGDSKSEERLTSDNSFGGADAGANGEAGNDNSASGVAGSGVGAQSLLLEASTEGTTGAVPYSGSVEWTRGTDELGQPTLLAKANIPARSLSVNLLIRRNADLTLPASHLMEIDFTVSDGFIGGGIASLPGILLKNEELVRGTPLFGASARVVGNSFLFALSAAEQDREKNLSLLGSRKWMDLALIYATSTRAIVTLEKDDAAQQLFDEVMAIWAEADAAAAPTPPPASEGAPAAVEGAAPSQ